MSPQKSPAPNLPEMLSFFGHTASSFQNVEDEDKECFETLPSRLLSLLTPPLCLSLCSILRRSLISTIVLLRNKGVLKFQECLPVFIRLLQFSDHDSVLSFIQHDISKASHPDRSWAQSQLFQILAPACEKKVTLTNEAIAVVPVILELVISLFTKSKWADAKTANAISLACFSGVPKIMNRAIHFFLSMPEQINEESDDEVDQDKIKQMKHALKVGKKTRSGTKKLDKVVRKSKKKSSINNSSGCLALQMIYDAHLFTERLFNILKSTKVFETKLAIMSLISRTIAMHKICFVPFYSFLQKYLQPHQLNVTSILAYTAQAVHQDVPEDVLSPILRAIADNFVNDHSAPEVMVVGLNAIRELCTRVPFAMSPELLSDLVLFRKNRDKGVVMSARSLIAVFRELYPSLLPRRERGKEASMKMRIPGVELLEEYYEHEEKNIESNRIITQQEFELINELKENQQTVTHDEFIDEGDIGNIKRKTRTYKDRVESAMNGNHEERKHKRKKGDYASKSNKEKRKTKNFGMMMHSRKMLKKSKTSLRDKQKQLRKKRIY